MGKSKVKSEWVGARQVGGWCKSNCSFANGIENNVMKLEYKKNEKMKQRSKRRYTKQIWKVVLISDKEDFRKRKIIMNKQKHYIMIKTYSPRKQKTLKHVCT